MKKRILLFISIMLSIILVSSCTFGDAVNKEAEESNTADYSTQSNENTGYDEDELDQTFIDWILGTEYGVEEIKFDNKDNTIEIIISDENYNKLAAYDKDDILISLENILKVYDIDDEFSIYFSNGELLNARIEQTPCEDSITATPQKETTAPDSIEAETINLIFIHHSVGENWLNAGLNEMLNENNIHVADTYYGWHDIGDRTDTTDWPSWFNDDIMSTVYNEQGNMTGYNSIEPASGENTIIMFKSCYPNSDVGNSIDDEKEIYLSLLDYFSKNTDKMFVLITPPPMQHISHPNKTRELTNWLVSSNGWRKNYTENNLFVFDFYNVLTDKDNHHMLVNGVESHIIDDNSNTLYYDSDGDDHPSDEGSLKAANEFVPLLLSWYREFSN